jgi:hypothetical protein
LSGSRDVDSRNRVANASLKLDKRWYKVTRTGTVSDTEDGKVVAKRDSILEMWAMSQVVVAES